MPSVCTVSGFVYEADGTPKPNYPLKFLNGNYFGANSSVVEGVRAVEVTSNSVGAFSVGLVPETYKVSTGFGVPFLIEVPDQPSVNISNIILE